ncbi:MAG: hypothetical protein MK212_16825 [Saprospiraceae bacterium]|nr:hypothetical protein [Saprospiraceae bacterium]
MLHATLKNKHNEDICLMIQADNHKWNYLCDCGFASDLSVKDCRDVNAVFVSHTHIDHFIHFDFLLRHLLGCQRTVTVCGPAGLAKNVQAKLRGFTWNLLTAEDNPVTFEVRELHGGNQIVSYLLIAPNWELNVIKREQHPIIFQNKAFTVRYTLLDHGIPSVAYLFEELPKLKINMQNVPYPGGKWVKELKIAYTENKPNAKIEVHGEIIKAQTLFEYLELQQGYKLGYIMDHLACEANHQKIYTLFKNCDEVYMESYYAQEDYDLAIKNNHSTAHISGQLAKQAGFRKLIPAHFSRRYHDPEMLAKIKEECLAAFRGI